MKHSTVIEQHYHLFRLVIIPPGNLTFIYFHSAFISTSWRGRNSSFTANCSAVFSSWSQNFVLITSYSLLLHHCERLPSIVSSRVIHCNYKNIYYICWTYVEYLCHGDINIVSSHCLCFIKVNIVKFEMLVVRCEIISGQAHYNKLV